MDAVMPGSDTFKTGAARVPSTIERARATCTAPTVVTPDS
jgi:hypothetical protein